MLLMAQ